MDSEYYTSKLEEANSLLELQQIRAETQQIRYNESLEEAQKIFDTLPQSIKDEYGGSLDTFIEKTDYGTTLTSNLTSAEQSLKSQLQVVKEEYDKYNEANEKIIETKKKILKLETLDAIAKDVAAGKYEIAAARIELATEQEVLTIEEGSRLMQGAFKQASDSERDNMLINMEPELRSKFLGYLATTKNFQGDYIKYYQNANDDVKKLINDPSVTKAMQEAGEANAEALRKGLQNATTWDKFRAWWADIIPGGKTSSDIYIEIGNKYAFQKMATGTNYVQSNGLAYLHQGEAVIPKKYNQPYQPIDNSNLENAISQLTQQVAQISSKVEQGINVKGQFIQRGSDLVATVQKANNKLSNNVLNNKVYAR